MVDRAQPIWPAPQEMKLRDDALPLSRAVLVAPAQAREADLAPLRLFADMIADDFDIVVRIVGAETPQGKVPIHIRVSGQSGGGSAPRNLPGEEGYLLSVTAGRVEAIGRDP